MARALLLAAPRELALSVTAPPFDCMERLAESSTRPVA